MFSARSSKYLTQSSSLTHPAQRTSPVVTNLLALSVLALASLCSTYAKAQSCQSQKLFEVQEQKWQGTGKVKAQGRFGIPGKNGFYFTSGMTIDADGAPRAFHPMSSKGLDDLINAGRPGNWWGILTHNGEPSGRPIVQGPNDPAPGYYISPTGLEDKSKSEQDPRRYADATRLPYVVLSGTAKQNLNAQFGDYVVVYNAHNKRMAYALYGDEWPKLKVGEGSVALAKELGVDADPRTGGAGDGITYLVFPNSRTTAWRAEESLDSLRAEAQKQLQAWGGIEQLVACVGK